MRIAAAIAAAVAIAPLAAANGPRAPLPNCPAGSYTPYVSQGCYQDGSNTDAFIYRSLSNQYNMTIEACTAECKSNGFRYAGLKYYGICFCADAFTAPKVGDDQCSFQCTGNNQEICGGQNTLSVYQDPTFPNGPNDVTVADYVPQGCFFDDAPSGRALPFKLDGIASLTPLTCMDACRAQGFPYAGTEFGGECWCGNNVGVDNIKEPDTDCNSVCAGDSTLLCGGSNRINIYYNKKLESTNPCVSGSGGSSSSTTSVATTAPASSSAGSPSSSAGSPSSSAGSPSSSTGSPSSSTGSASSTAGAPSSSTSSPSSTAGAPSSSTGSASSTAGAPSSSTSSPSSTAGAPSSTAGAPPSSTSSPSSTAGAPSSTAGAPSSTAGAPSSTAGAPSSTAGAPSSTAGAPSSSANGPSSNTPPPSSVTPPPSQTQTLPTSTGALCTVTSSAAPTCEFSCGNWCAPALPDWSDKAGCLLASKSCSLKLASCFATAGWPGVKDCFSFSSWCSSISDYCNSSDCSGGKRGCYDRVRPSNMQRPTVTTSVVPCPTTIVSSVVPTTSVCPPAPTNICTQPSNDRYGYSSTKPVAGVSLPIVSCNDVKSDFGNNPFKFYSSPSSNQCSSFKWNNRPNVCQDACKAQLDNCQASYTTGCRSNGGNYKREADTTSVQEIERRTFGWLWNWFGNASGGDQTCANSDSQSEWGKSGCDRVDCWGQGANNVNNADQRCRAQYKDCLAVNSRVDPGSSCKNWCSN